METEGDASAGPGVAADGASVGAGTPMPVSGEALGLERFRSIKIVHAGEILLVTEDGAMVRRADGTDVALAFLPEMTAPYMPVAGDRWMVYEDGYQSISPREAFVAGYVLDDGAEDAAGPSEATVTGAAHGRLVQGAAVIDNGDGTHSLQMMGTDGALTESEPIAAGHQVLLDLELEVIGLWSRASERIRAAVMPADTEG